MMSGEASKALSTFLTLTLLIGLAPIFHNVAAQGEPRIFVDPAENIFYTNETSVGATFAVAVKSAGFFAPGVYSYELIVHYDKNMLVAAAAAIPDGHWLTPTLSLGNVFKVDPGTINTVEGYVSFAVTLLGPEPGKTGGGTIAAVTLKITEAPPAGGSITSKIEASAILVDPDAVQIFSHVTPATFAFTYAGSLLPWYLKVEPEIVAAYAVGDNVVITVSIHDVTADVRIIGVQFKIVLPEILWTQEEWVSQGPFFEYFGEKILHVSVERDAEGHLVVMVFLLLLPNPEGGWTNFPEGSGALVYMNFSVILLPENVTRFPLCLSDVMIVDSDANFVPCRSECSALVAPPKPEDLNVDLMVNLQDVVLLAVAFGSTPTSARWNSKADLNRDGKVNILDGVMIAKAFGWTLPGPP
jgi:hypothetical protein